MRNINAQVGFWYQDLQSGAQFEVVALDEGEQTIDVQLLDGEVCEYDFESWDEMQLQAIEEPEDWRHAFELSDEDSLDPDRAFKPDSDVNPVDDIEPDIINGLDDDF